MKDFTKIMSDILNIVNKYHYENDSYRSEEHEEEVNAIVDACQIYTKNKWIPIGEKLPEDYESALITCEDGSVTIGEFIDGAWYRSGGHGEVLAWRPLPEPWEEDDAG